MTRLPIPDAALTMHTIALAKTRAGKSSALRLIVEHGLDQGIPVTIIDPKGDWWGIKSSADGERAGYPVVIFGGDHADVPINEHAGAHVAELIATSNRPALIDLGGWMPGPRTRFFVAFASAFFRLTRGKRWLVIDECHNFAPQGKVLDPDSGKMLHWANRLASEAAGKGVTLFSASQRPQKVHKDYVTSHDTLIALRAIHPRDRAAAEDWMAGFDPKLSKEVGATLAMLERGEAWVWSPEAKFGPKRLQFPLFRTFDSFKPADGDEHTAKLKGWASVDLDDVKARLADVVAEAEANDPKTLKAEVARLTKALAAAHQARPVDQAACEAAAQAERRAVLKEVGEDLRDIAADALALMTTLTDYADELDGYADECERPDGGDAGAPHGARTIGAPKGLAAAPDGAICGLDDAGILQQLARLRALGVERSSREIVAALCGFGNIKSARIAKAFADLNAAGLIAASGGDVALTSDGVQAAPKISTPLSAEAMREAVVSVVGAPADSILRDLTSVYPRAMDRAEVARRAGYSNIKSAAFAGAVAKLVRMGFVSARGGELAAEAVLFPSPTRRAG